MPRRKAALSLEELCLNSVINNYENAKDQLMDQPYRFINNIFIKLCLTLDLDNLRLASKIFVHFGAESLHHLDLFDLPMDRLLPKISQVCKNLLKLNLQRFSNQRSEKCSISAEAVIKLVQHLPQLRHIKMKSRKECNDRVVAAIAKNCAELRHLDASRCAEITDVGLRSLSGCEKLEFLDICGTLVTPIGCNFFLNNSPILKVFRNDHWDELFDLLKREFRSNGTIQAQHLDKMPTKMRNDEDIRIVTTIFPNLRRLFIYSDYFGIDFTMLPQRLTSLHLKRVRLVDVSVIDRSCPNLEKLTLNCCSIDATVYLNDSAKIISFKNLRKLHLYDIDEEFVSDLSMEMLLMHCVSLECLVLVFCSTITDNLMSRLVKSNAFWNLKVLKLAWCPGISSRSIIELLEMQSPLHTLIYRNCFQINVSDNRVIRNYVTSNNLQVKFDEDDFGNE